MLKKMPGAARRLRAAAPTALMVTAAFTSAQAAEPSALKLDGFGTLGVVYSDENQADFVASLLAPEGAGYSRTWSAKVDSKLGFQLSADVASRSSAVVQVVFEQQYDGTYGPAVEWANISFDITQDLELRVGRMVLPIYMTSEYRKVGYANPSSRPSPEVYHLVPVTNTDGVSLAYRSRVGEVTNTFQVLYGRRDADLPEEDVYVDTGNGITVANTAEWGAVAMFASYSNIRLTVDALDPLFDAYRAFGPQGEAIAERYDIDNKRFEIISVGGRYDPGNWFVMGEWARSHSRTLVGDNRGWYITGGYRFSALTPYATVADRRVYSETQHPGIDLPQAQPLNATLNQTLSDAVVQSRVAAGLRWDFTHGVALKVQLDRIDLGAGSRGVLANEQSEFERGGEVTLLSTTLDFVF